MNYDETVAFLFSRLPAYHRIGKAAYKANLDNTLLLDSYFDHPHRHYRTLHVAGTNGKGSVSHMLASILYEAGYKTGLYTSPHLRDFRERIKINGEMIPESEVVAFVEKHQQIIEKIEPSFFELTAAMAFDYFARMGVDIAVIEVGMGGRLDSTNIVIPDLSVITNIGHDHMEFLGKNLEEVAGEKAGIIKKNIPVVIGETHPETKNVFLDRAMEMNTPVSFADEKYRCDLEGLDTLTGRRSWTLHNLENKSVIKGTTPLGGLAQAKNLQTVAMAFSVICSQHNLTLDHFTTGIDHVIINTGLMGRWQVLSNNPLTVCDTGHNREGLEYVVRQIVTAGKEKIHIVLGFVNDKDLSSVLPLFPQNAAYYFTKASIPRALDEKALQAEGQKCGLKGDAYPTVAEAVGAARSNSSSNDIIFIGGSTFVVAEVV